MKNREDLASRVFEKVVLFFCVGVFLIGSVSALQVNFTSTTPANATSSDNVTVGLYTDAVSDSYSFLDFNEDVFGWYTFTNTNSTHVLDELGRHNLTYTGGAAESDIATEDYAFGTKSYNASLSTGYLTVPTLPNNTYTIGFWIKSLAAPSARREFYEAIGATYPYVSLETTGKVMVRYGAADYSTSNSLVSDGEWHNVVVLINKEGQDATKIWIDGILDKSGSSGTSTPLITEDYTLAYPMSFGEDLAQGELLDDLVIFNRTLVLSEVKSLYNATANNYSNDFTSSMNVDVNYNFGGYVLNKTGTKNNTELRTLEAERKITISSPAYEYRQYTNPVELNIFTNFDATCKWSNDSGITNYTFDSSGLRLYNSSVTFPLGENTVTFYCNDSEFVSKDWTFTVSDNITYYVDASSGSCSDSYSKTQATNDSTPFCSIAAAEVLANPGDEVVVKYGYNYCDGFTSTRSGNSTHPIIIRGENNSARTFLNGSCASEINAFSFTGEDYWIVRYFEAYNFSYDGGNVHANGADNSLDIRFENLTFDNLGWEDTGAQGDSISFHENCSGWARWINSTTGVKGGVTDVNGANTNYSNIFISNFENYGIDFADANVNGEVHYVSNAYVENSGNCLETYDDVIVNSLICVNNTQTLSGEIYVRRGTTNITRFNISQSGAQPSVNVIAATGNFVDGEIDSDVNLSTSGNATLTNVTYLGSAENIGLGSTLTRKWYLDVSSNLENVNITITNSTGQAVYSGLTGSNFEIPQQILTDYINMGGTTTYYSNYSISATKDGYVSQTEVINLTATENTGVVFTMAVTPTTPTTETTISGGSSATNSLGETENFVGKTNLVRYGFQNKFSFGGESHKFILRGIDRNLRTAEIDVYSDKKVLTLSEGSSENVDLDGNGEFDLTFYLDKIYDDKVAVDLRIENFSKSSEEVNMSNEDIIVTRETRLDYSLMGFVGLIVLIVVILLIGCLSIWFVLKKHKKKKSK